MDWFRRRNFQLYSSLEENASIELTEQSAEKTVVGETECDSIRETRDFAPGNTTSYGSLKKEAEFKEAKLTTWQASWNITNMIQGTNILNAPFVLLVGGIPGILLTVLVGYISIHTCFLLINCQYDEDEEGGKAKKRPTLHDIAVHNLGKKAGVVFIDLLQLLLMFGNCVYQLLTCGHMINALFPENPLGFNAIILLFSIPLFPFAFVKSIILVSHFSCVSVIVTSFAHFGIVVYMFSKLNQWLPNEFPITTDIYPFSVSLGMIVFGFDTQLYVNALDNKMKEGSNIKKMIVWTHLIAVFVKIFFGIVGVFTFGHLTRETITNNIDIEPLKYFFNVFYPLKFFLVFQFPYFAIIDLIQEKLFQGVNQPCFPSCVDQKNALKWWALLLRMSLICLSVAVCVVFPDVAVMSGYTGCTVGAFVMFLMPVYFHLNMFWRKMKWYRLLHDFLVLLVGVFVIFFGVFSFVQREIITGT